MTSLVQPSTTTGRWRQVAAELGDAVAVRTPEGSVTFAEAGERSVERGRAIAAAIGAPGVPVAVETESDIESVIALLAVLCSGHPVIALDPFLPEDRRTHILELAGARLMSPQEIGALPPSSAQVADSAPDDPAVLIFTSGSTGRPKGVVHGQRSWVNQARDGRDVLGFGPDDRAGVLLPLSFGAGIDALLMPLLNGAGLLLWDVRRRGTAGLRAWLAAESATTVHCTPSLLRSWLADLAPGETLDAARLLTTCGEPIHGSDVAALRECLLPRGIYCSWSGSSECGNLAFNPYPPERELPAGAIPVGIPAADKHVRIVDDEGADLPSGEAGEVVVESAHLALGYHGDPETTALRFRPLTDGRAALHTGDLGRFDEGGRLHLLGRRDDAIKVRGYLVEPLEVEAALRALAWVVDAVVTGDADSGVLTAHVAVDQNKWTPSAAEIRNALGESLAPWMIPREVVVMTQLPRTERGKVDRAALPPPPPRSPEPVRGPTEAALKAVWCTVLGLDDVGRNEDFVELGGDSLAAAKMLGELRDHWLVDVPSAEFANDPTVAGLARLLDGGHRDRRSAATGSITRLRAGTGTPLFFAAGAGSPAASLLPVVRALGGEAPVYGLQAHGLEQRGRADRSVSAAAARAVRDIVAAAPCGPYRLAGYSFGAFVMLEAAGLLRDRGETVDRLVLLDPRFESEDAAREALPDREAANSEEPETVSLAVRAVAAWNRVAMRFLVATAGLWRLPVTLQWTVFWDLGRQLLRKHRPTPYPGPVTLLVASDNDDDLDRWREIVTGELDVVHLDGDHHSMMRDPHARAAAEELL